MNIPDDLVSKSKAALQRHWTDYVTVKRGTKAGSVLGEETIYSNQICHLSSGSRSALNQTSGAATTTDEFKLFVDTSIQLKAGDNLTIIHKGQTFQGKAGRPFHGEFSNSAKVDVQKVT